MDASIARRRLTRTGAAAFFLVVAIAAANAADSDDLARFRTAQKIAQGGDWTSVIGVMEGTFTQPMPIGGGKFIQPTGKAFKLMMSTVGHWKNGVMDKEYLFWDNQGFMKQIGLAH